MDTPTPDNPPKTEETTKASIRNHLFVIIPAMLVVLLIAIVIGMNFFSGNEPKPAVESSAPKFENQLTPAAEIKVGDNRYVSPCQALPLSSVTSIFGKDSPQTKIIEDSLATSVPAGSENDRLETTCTYGLAADVVTLRADQYTDPSEYHDIKTVAFTSPDKIEPVITTLKKKAGNNKDAKELVASFEKSLATYKQYEKEYDDEVLAKVDLNGMKLPELFGRGAKMIYGNVTYVVETEKYLKDYDANDMAKMNKAFKVVATNAANPKLDQSPAPTILGNSDHIGSTKILEPCVILSGDVFKTITGTDQNDLVGRETLPKDSSHDVVDKKAKKRVVLSNSCERTNEGGDTDTRAKLELYQAKTVAYAQQLVKDYADDPGNPPVAITTNADEAYFMPNATRPDLAFYTFRVGPYYGILHLEKSVKNNSTGDLDFFVAPQDTQIKAINVLVDQIKKQQ